MIVSRLFRVLFPRTSSFEFPGLYVFCVFSLRWDCASNCVSILCISSSCIFTFSSSLLTKAFRDAFWNDCSVWSIFCFLRDCSSLCNCFSLCLTSFSLSSSLNSSFSWSQLGCPCKAGLSLLSVGLSLPGCRTILLGLCPCPPYFLCWELGGIVVSCNILQPLHLYGWPPSYLEMSSAVIFSHP